MEEALSFFRAFEAWIYLLLGLGGLYFVRKFILAWQEMRGAGFGLERESAQARLNQSASVLVLLLTMTVAEFVLVSFVAPSFPGAMPLPTSTLNLLATATYTLPPGTPLAASEVISSTVTPTVRPEIPNCESGKIEITSPEPGKEVNGIVSINGSASIPNFGFYKLEMKHPEDNIWLTLQAGRSAVQAGELGKWDTRRLAPGAYDLGLVVVDNQATASDPCVIQVRVITTPEDTPVP